MILATALWNPIKEKILEALKAMEIHFQMQKKLLSSRSPVHKYLKQRGHSHTKEIQIQLLKVLETRKTALQNEQGMAFARAVAAGFDIDHVKPLVAFAEGFGASRLMEACSRFKDLWKRYHKKGQWLETDANKSGALVSALSNKNNDSDHDTVLENNGKPVSDVKTSNRTSVPQSH